MPSYNPTPTNAINVPTITTDIFSLLKPRLDDFCEAIRHQPPCRWGFTSCRVFLLDGDIVDLETENGIDIPDEVVGDARSIAAESNALALAWALPHHDSPPPWWFVAVELPGGLEFHASSHFRGAGFGPFAPWESWELGPDAWTSLPTNLPDWAERNRHEVAAPVERRFVQELGGRNYAAEVEQALATNRDRLARGALEAESVGETFHCVSCGTQHMRDASGRTLVATGWSRT